MTGKDQSGDETSVEVRHVYRQDQDKDRLSSSDEPVQSSNDRANRGRRPTGGVGVVQGSGAGAGGGGPAEDFDSDPVGGGGTSVMPVDDKANPQVQAEDDILSEPSVDKTSGASRARTSGG